MDQRLRMRRDDGGGHDPGADGETGQIQGGAVGDGDDVVYAVELCGQAHLAGGAGLGAGAGGVGGRADIPVEEDLTIPGAPCPELLAAWARVRGVDVGRAKPIVVGAAVILLVDRDTGRPAE